MSAAASTTRTLREARAARSTRTGVIALARPSRRVVERPGGARVAGRGAHEAVLSDRRIRQLISDHDAATAAVCAPDVSADLSETARDTALILGLSPVDARTLTTLLTFARRSYAHGHMDATEAARERTGAAPLALLLNPRGGAR